MVVDCHVHLYDTDMCDVVGIECDQGRLIEQALDAGVDRIAVSSLGRDRYIAMPSQDEVRDANLDVIRCIKEFPDRVYGYCYINPRNLNWRDELTRGVDHGVIGVKLWLAAKASDPIVEPVVEYAIEANLVVLQHCYLRVRGNMGNESDPSDVACLGAKYPEAKIIMAHAGANLRSGIDAIKGLDNVAVDTSGCDPVRGVVERLLPVLGAKRILFGSDAPGRSFGVQMAKVRGAAISEVDKELILGTNFMELIGEGG